MGRKLKSVKKIVVIKCSSTNGRSILIDSGKRILIRFSLGKQVQIWVAFAVSFIKLIYVLKFLRIIISGCFNTTMPYQLVY